MKFIFSLLLLCTFSLSFAQLSLNTLQGNTPINDGDEFTFNTLIFEDAKLKFKISNSSATDNINVLAEVVSFTNTDGTNCQFCVQPECFFEVNPGQTIPNAPIALAPGQDNGNFDYFSNTNPGDGTNYPMEYVLRFYMVDNNGAEVGNDITITYKYSPNIGTDEFDLKSLGVTLQNTLISETLNFDSNKSISFDVYDMNARKINSYKLNSGQHQVNMRDLSTGFYILIFKDNSGRQSHVKIQKK